MDKNLTTFYIARHGQTEWNQQGLLMGQKDSPLTLAGEEQASNLAKELQHIQFDLAFSSDLLRAKRTAEIIALEKKLAIQTTELLRERAYGEYEGKPYDALESYDTLMEKLSDEERVKFTKHGVESIEALVTRTITFIRETAITHPEKNILVVAHGNLIHALLIHIGFGTYQNFPLHSIGNTAYFKLETDGIDFFVKETKRIILPSKA